MKKTLIYLVGLVNIALIMYFWWTGSSFLFVDADTSSVAIAFGKLFGLFAQVTILLQLVLIGKISWIEQLFGHDKMNKIHRWLGYSVAFFFLFHPLFLVYGYAQQAHVGMTAQFIRFLSSWEDILGACVGFMIFVAIILVSLPPIRRKLKYEYWYFTHLSVYLAIGLVFSHQIATGPVARGAGLAYWLILNFAVGGVYVAYRFIRPLYVFNKHRFYVDKIVSESDDVYSVYIKGRELASFTFQAGQFANYTFLQKGLWYTHPFSFSVAPNGEYIRFTAKALGDFTKRIPQIKPGTYVIVDGPLGVFTEKKSHREKYLFIAGGIGITPIRALAESLSDKPSSDMVLLYGNRSVKDTVFKEELDEYVKATKLVLSNPTAEEESAQYEKGYIDKEKIERLVPDVKDREIYICGPLQMMDSVVALLEAMGIPKQQIHFERFGY